MPKLTRKERRELRRKRRLEMTEIEQVQDPSEKAAEQILLRERTSYPTDEGYHFIRPAWHRNVYGGGKQSK